MTTGDHLIPELDARGLRKFAFTIGAAVVVVFALVLPWLLGVSFPRWPWVVAAVLAVWGLVAPASLGPVYRTWMRFGLLLHRIVSPVVLGVMFFLMVTPVALVLRALRRDAMARRFDPSAESYRVVSRPGARRSMERPF